MSARFRFLEIEGVLHAMVGDCWVPADAIREGVTKVRRPADCLPHLAGLRTAKQEVFAVLTLDGNHNIIKCHEITKGLANQSQVHPRETFVPALEDRAVGIIVAHNHPSGSLEPSNDDLSVTRRLAEAGRLLGIPVMDHLIVTADGFTSLRERFPDCFAGRSS